jgi:hypothetical protein
MGVARVSIDFAMGRRLARNADFGADREGCFVQTGVSFSSFAGGKRNPLRSWSSRKARLVS